MLIQSIKYQLLRFTPRYAYLSPSVRHNKKWMGNSYGGFYVSPMKIGRKSIVYSFGIGCDVSFDQALMNACGCVVYGFDPTPKSIEWVSQQTLAEDWHFLSYGLGTKSAEVEFYLPKNPNHVSGSMQKQNNVSQHQSVLVPIKSLPDIMQELGHTHIDVLKMDIEGSEYEVLPKILQHQIPIHQILVEFHSRLFQNGEELTRNTVKLLKQAGYEIFGVSNSFQEISFIKNIPSDKKKG